MSFPLDLRAVLAHALPAVSHADITPARWSTRPGSGRVQRRFPGAGTDPVGIRRTTTSVRIGRPCSPNMPGRRTRLGTRGLSRMSLDSPRRDVIPDPVR